MPSIRNPDSMEGDIDSPTMRKPQQHRLQDQDEVETDIETPLSSPERETASTTGSGSANLTVSTTLPSTSMSTDITPTARNGSGSAGKTTESKGNGNGNRKDALPALELNSSRSNDCVDGQEEDEVQDYSNWPLRDIKDPHGNDVLYGRGGGTNHHPGNKRYRKLVEGRKVDYVNSKRLDKPLVALEIIKEWRTQVPPGRFLKIDEDTGFWHDVGDRKAREKTSQALREKAPLLRKQQEEQRKEKLSTQKESSKNTRFDVPDKKSKVSKNLTRVMLARDHSLGRDYIPADEPVSVKGFSWTAPVLDVDAKSEEAPKLADWENPPKSSGSWEDRLDSDPTTATAYDVHGPRSGSVPVSVSVSGPTPSVQVQSSPTSHTYLGTSGGDYSQPSSSQDAMPPPSYSTNWQQVQHNPHTPKSSQTIMNEWRGFQSEDLARKNYSGVEQDYRHSRSADDAFRRTGKRGYYGTNSDNSHLQSGDYERFANIVGSNTGHPNYMHSWTSASTPNRSNSDGMYKPPDVVYDTSRRSNSSGMYDASSYHSPDRMSIRNSYRMEESWASPQPHATHSQTSPQSSIDYYNHGHPAYRPPPTTTTAESFLHDPNASHMITSPNPNTCIPRPPNVKRDTSHKMETMDVEPTTKRMNRQVSIGHRSSSMSSVDEVTEKDIKHLNSSLEQSSLAGDDETNEAPFHNSQHSRRPQSLKESDRVTTIDRFVVDLDGKSSMLDMGLKEEEENGAEQPGSEGSSININIKEVLTTTRPAPLSGDDRISTLGTIDSDLFSGLTNAAPV